MTPITDLLKNKSNISAQASEAHSSHSTSHAFFQGRATAFLEAAELLGEFEDATQKLRVAALEVIAAHPHYEHQARALSKLDSALYWATRAALKIREKAAV